jgi:hypothetical protein
MSAARIAELEAKAAAREGRPGYKRNHAAIQRELAKLRRDVSLPDGGSVV